MDTFGSRCCKVDNVCGYSLKRGVFYVGLASFLVSTLALLTSLISLRHIMSSEMQYNSNPVLAIDMLMALFCTSVSIYQIILNIMLLWQSVWTKGSAFICSTWYVSHLSILTFYTMLFFARTIICISEKFCVSACFTLVGAFTYNGVFIYFMVIVYSYLRTLEEVDITD